MAEDAGVSDPAKIAGVFGNTDGVITTEGTEGTEAAWAEPGSGTTDGTDGTDGTDAEVDVWFEFGR
jgi:hypothetical protein